MPDSASLSDMERLRAVEAELAELRAEFDDLTLLYQVTTEHGEAVENQLAEANQALSETQKRLSDELTEAANYIVSILPPPREEGPRTRWLLEPSTELGGDSFGYHDIDDDHFALYLLDVCGHGVGAALLSVSAINVLRSAALPNTDFHDPGAVLTALNEAFPMERQNNMYFTLWYGVFQRSTGTLRFASAGHPPSVLCGSDGAVTLLSTPAIAIGMFAEITYASAVQRIAPGDRLHVISDGTFEVETEPGEMLAFDTFVSRLGNAQDPQEVLQWIRSLNGPGHLPDDFSLLTAEF